MSAMESPSAEPRPRKAWIAVALALVGGSTGLVYCGRLRRAVLWVISLFFGLVAAGCLLFYLPNGRIAWIAFAVFAVLFNFGLIADTIRIALRREPATKWYQRWWFYLGFAIVTSFVINGVLQVGHAYWEEAFYIPTDSMSPTILAGDRILVDKLRYRTTPIRHGDVVVFWLDNRRAQNNPNIATPGGLFHVKRVVGLPGDVIEFRNEKLFRNGAPVDEPYTVFSTATARIDPRLIDTPPTVVGQDELFVAGDNRRETLDSRFFGCIPRGDVVGRAAIIYWSREVPPPSEHPPAARNLPTPPTPTLPQRIRWERFGLRLD